MHLTVSRTLIGPYIFHNIFKYMIFQKHQKALWSKGLRVLNYKSRVLLQFVSQSANNSSQGLDCNFQEEILTAKKRKSHSLFFYEKLS